MNNTSIKIKVSDVVKIGFAFKLGMDLYDTFSLILLKSVLKKGDKFCESRSEASK